MRARPNIVVGRGGTSKAEASLRMQQALGHLPSARQWNANNVPRLYDLVPKKVGRKVVKDRKGKPVMVRVRTGFRNVIDEHGAHV
jgi:hypothetical protein